MKDNAQVQKLFTTQSSLYNAPEYSDRVLRAQDLVACFLSLSQCQLNTAKAELLKNSGKMEGQKHTQEVLEKEEQRALLVFEGGLSFQGDGMYKQVGHSWLFLFPWCQGTGSLEPYRYFCYSEY